jgi:hypothetical protein
MHVFAYAIHCHSSLTLPDVMFTCRPDLLYAAAWYLKLEQE